MEYQIRYERNGEAKYTTVLDKRRRCLMWALTGIIILSAAIWSMGADWAVTRDALEGMAENLVQGNELKEAFSEFCLDILRGAEGG